MDQSPLDTHGPCTGRTTRAAQIHANGESVSSYTSTNPRSNFDLARRTRLNAQSPICGVLPSELLAEIFAYLSTMERPSKTSWTRGRKAIPNTSSWRIGWIKVTHVCRHWRTVAIDYSFLWGKISYELGAQWAMLMMERARFSTISIRQSHWPRHPTSAGEIEYIPQHIGQIDELELHGHYAELRKIFENLHGKPAPRLRYLEIDCTDLQEEPSFDQLVNLPEVLFDGQSPRLQILIIDGPCRLSLSSPWLRNLRMLLLSNSRSV